MDRHSEWLTVYPRLPGLKSPSSNVKKLSWSHLFKMAHRRLYHRSSTGLCESVRVQVPGKSHYRTSAQNICFWVKTRANLRPAESGRCEAASSGDFGHAGGASLTSCF